LESGSTAVRKTALSGAVAALYVAVMYATQPFAFGGYQIRIATSLYGLGYHFPFLIVPLGLSNMLSNVVLGGFGLPDAVGGALAGLATAGCVRLVGRSRLPIWASAIPITLIPGLMVPIWLSPILGMPYALLAFQVCVGQLAPGLVGALLIGRVDKLGYTRLEGLRAPTGRRKGRVEGNGGKGGASDGQG